MIGETANRDVVSAFVAGVRKRLRDGKHNESAGRAARDRRLNVSDEDAGELFAGKLPDKGPGEETEPPGVEPFISRDPLVALVQASLAAHLKDKQLATATPADHPYHGFFSHVWQSVTEFVERDRLTLGRGVELAGEVAEGMLGRVAEGSHPFNKEPAEHKLDENARLIIVGDWGSGWGRAQAVAKLMADEVQRGLEKGREVHVIHLGDVYFAGEAEEYRDHVLARSWWPVTAEQANAGVGSWALAGNHDLYGGAHAYFTVMLADPRFHLQQAKGTPTSWFRLTSPSWEIIGLDTSWNDDPFEMGQTGLLEDPQADKLHEWIAADRQREAKGRRKRLLLSHHQFLTVYDKRLKDVLASGRQPVLHKKMAQKHILTGRAVTAWIWGHEHRCMGFDDDRIAFPRCLGHGGQLQQAPPAGTKLEPPGKWTETATFTLAGARWGSFGFAVLDLEGPNIEVSYRLDGAQPAVGTERFA
jgi:hypothetical protein